MFLLCSELYRDTAHGLINRTKHRYHALATGIAPARAGVWQVECAAHGLAGSNGGVSRHRGHADRRPGPGRVGHAVLHHRRVEIAYYTLCFAIDMAQYLRQIGGLRRCDPKRELRAASSPSLSGFPELGRSY